MKKIKIRGLFRFSGWIFVAWGAITLSKGLLDAFALEPEVNFYAPHKWGFVSLGEWLRWAGFEIAYGCACITVGGLLFEFSKRVKEFITREEGNNT